MLEVGRQGSAGLGCVPLSALGPCRLVVKAAAGREPMQTQREPRVGEGVLLVRSGHAPRSSERATVVAVYGNGTVLRVCLCDGRETFVPRQVVEMSRLKV
jgi:hypothetical protein